MYEERNPIAKALGYKIDDLINFIDVIPEIRCMVLQRDTDLYAPHDKDWIKEQVYQKLKREMKKE